MSENIKDTKNKRKSRYFDIYILKVLRIISPKHGITSNAKKQINSILCILSNIIYERCVKILSVSKRKTISPREIMCAIKFTFTGNLQLAIIRECSESLEKYSKLGQTHDRSSKHTQIGMIFSPSVCEKFLRNFGLSKALVSENSPIYLSTAMEYICAEILTSSLRHISSKKSRLSIREIELGIRNDNELNTLFISHNMYLIGGMISNSFFHTEEKQYKNSNMIEEIKKIQDVHDCLFIPKSFFERLVRYYTDNHTGITKINKNVVIILQYVIENYVVQLLQEANRLSVYTGRKKVAGDDIKFILSLTEKDNTCFKIIQNMDTDMDKKNLQNIDIDIDIIRENSYDSISDIEKD
jgi:histone H3/H4